ncbi:hypothetical protein CCACVL1_23467 [Corchorus capsularis]|uniref:Uncharacterized protein n=1 Tax=Corchorus capsularis TaxID=210143 RepID=A0A1R3GTU2_COCAP|nr:hypothetical protein CCACVL1_23467 [Corchorus capsularis]
MALEASFHLSGWILAIQGLGIYYFNVKTMRVIRLPDMVMSQDFIFDPVEFD